MGAWLSDQSKVIGLDYNFIETLNSLESKFKDKEVERPLHWGGYCIEPIKVEFWQGRPSRLHDRLEYKIEDGKWIYKRLAP
jgi:pyridoxamine 5'-phosphate oxidase